MTIQISLSESSIERAIRRLERMQENLQQGLEETVDILAREGGQIAQAAYGDMAIANGYSAEGFGLIISTGENNLIAEFGAGQATMPVMFKNAPHTPVYEGSYSELVGSKEYYEHGSWHFGGKYYTEVPARHGMLDAKEYLIEHSTEVAKGAIRL